MFEAVVVVVACCAGLGLTLSFLTLGTHRPTRSHRQTDGNEDEKEEGRPGGGGRRRRRSRRGGGRRQKDEGEQSEEAFIRSSSRSSSCSSRSSSSNSRKRVMVVIAHPDDEVMFFGPTILHFTKQEGALVHLLCMSTGDYYGQGRVRGRELLCSCDLLGVSRENVVLYRCDAFPDNPEVRWHPSTAAKLINHHLHALEVDMVVTFDLQGVSGHANHTALYLALQHLVEKEMLPRGCEAFALDTVGIVRKYASYLDVPLSYSLSQCAFVVDRQHHAILQRAMRAHSSQYVWFRRLYMYFSRYVLINTLSRISP